MSTSSTARRVNPGSDRVHTRAAATPSAVVRRCAAVTAVALTAITATVTLAPVTGAVTVDRPPAVENTSATRAVAAITGSGTGAFALPDDFTSVFGYRPSTIDGLLVNPGGDCSSPVPLPAEFDIACKAHDLGYDLLRYADLRGEPLGPWARQAIDATLDLRMRQACADRTGTVGRARCRTMADIADVAVDLNSRRQHYGAPVVESLFAGSGVSGWLVGIVGLGVAGTAVLLRFLLDAIRHRIATGAPTRFGAVGASA
ncbi:hypothetical protein [Nocardia aurea]|uniref:Prokaryotic phospholipase A2 n=1 Tax=Nocardia aurea TaxID=2144174 RepID=A0ABV3FZL7_9NOCA